MSQCLNPTCIHKNSQGTSFCEKCGSKILLDDRYRPIKIIGEGGFGRTFQAVDEKRLNTPCVIKQFLPQQAGRAALENGKSESGCPGLKDCQDCYLRINLRYFLAIFSSKISLPLHLICC